MKKSKFTEQQIDRVCASASGGGSQVCRKMGISEATFHPWKQLYGGLIPSEVRSLVTSKNRTGLRKVVANLTLPGDTYFGRWFAAKLSRLLGDAR